MREGMGKFPINLTPTVAFLAGFEIRPSSARSDNAPSSALGEIDLGTTVYDATSHQWISHSRLLCQCGWQR